MTKEEIIEILNDGTGSRLYAYFHSRPRWTIDPQTGKRVVMYFQTFYGWIVSNIELIATSWQINDIRDKKGNILKFYV